MRSSSYTVFTFLMLFGMVFMQVAQIQDPANYVKVMAIISAEEDLNETADSEKDSSKKFDDLNKDFLPENHTEFLVDFAPVFYSPFELIINPKHTRSHIKPPPETKEFIC